MAIADIETIVIKSGERRESMDEFENQSTPHKHKLKEDNSDQMSLF